MAEAATPVKQSKKKTWLIIIGALVLLVVAAGVGAMLFLHNRQMADDVYYEDNDPTHQQRAQQTPPPEKPGAHHAFAPLETFTANLAGDDHDRFAQVGVVIELADPKAEEAFKAVLPAVRSEVLLLITSKTADDLLSMQGKQQLATQISDIARKNIPPEFKRAVYAARFSAFVIQ
jgi:flagellar FliL protein